MASEIITATFGDLRLVVPHGMQPPTESGGGDGGGGPVTLSSYELDTEDWSDQEQTGGGGRGGGGGGGRPEGQKPPKGSKEKGGKPEKGETGVKEVDDIVDKYTESGTADIDERSKDLLDPDKDLRPGTKGKGPQGEGDFPVDVGEEEGEGEGEGEGKGGEGEGGEGKGKKKPGEAGAKKPAGDVGKKMPQPKSIPKVTRADVDVFWDKFNQQRREYLNDPRTAPDEMQRGYTPLDPIHPPGIGLGGELMNIGFSPMRTGLWKEAVKDWFKSLPQPQFEDKWTREDVRLQSPLRQMSGITGYSVRLPARNLPAMKPKVAKCLVLVDVSGSVFAKGVQEAFASILRAVPADVADITIFTFDVQGKEGPFKPRTYNPKLGGGGTEPWGFIATMLATPAYSPREIDGYLMLTDGAFANPPEGLIKKPEDWCFVMVSSYTADAIPEGAKIIETFVDDPEWQKHMKEAKSTEVMKRTIIKKKEPGKT
jgi:hypothetical protein